MRISDWSSDVCSSDLFEGEQIGTLFIQTDLRVMRERLNTYLGIIAFVIISATCIAFLLSLRLQKLISGPISLRAATANQEIGSATCRERVCPDVKISVGAVTIKKK